MKINLILIILFSVILVCEAQERKSIDFANSSWSKILQKAKKEKKAIFLYAYTPSCRWCRQMEKEVFTDKEVADYYNSRFVSYKIDIEDGAEGEALAGKYGINAFPTYMYFNKEGVQVHQSGSAKSAEEFILDGKDAFNPEKALFSLKRRYESGDRSPAFLYNYSNALTSYHQKDSPEEKVVREYLESQSAQQLESEKNLKYIFTKYLSFHSPATQYFLENQNKFTPLFKEDEVKHKAEKIITGSANIAGREDDALLLKQVDQAIAANFVDTSRLSSLARIYFYQGQGEWVKYAEATLEYGRSHSGDDWRTMYETAIYLKHFAKDIQALELGNLIMERVIIEEKSYDNLNLYAQLQHRLGRDTQALETAREAIAVARKSGEESSEAAKLVAELQTANKK
ncbi:thioredoxin family protein [Pontibacter diazotrophicus]|uniref:Thioredoxin family protein n=1 Tax=Pontibacter diazotrophicus TaxID=1400979 RepID=A0A3D8LHE5_9BACT|nr:thioredoxin fold domain-containing protein [Pontibacter diazotrophicus]RDV16664.1 thioredoxin family protein [Pontibacter diazotrophicus]